jgi:hypothetical protein
MVRLAVSAQMKRRGPYRDAIWAEVIVGVDPNPANKERITSWAREYWDALHPYSAGGAYVNFMMDEGRIA